MQDMYQMYDAHIHLSDPWYGPYTEQILQSMRKMQIAACCVSVDYETSQQTLALAEQSNLILPFLGVHPEEASQDIEPVKDLIMSNRSIVAGVGEIGLDRTLASGGMHRQRRVFEDMLGLAESLGKPVSIHSRKTIDEVLDILTSFGKGRILLHWFDGNKRQLARAMDMGCFVSYGPVTVYANDKQVLLSKTDRNRILVETDGPVRFSRCFERGPTSPVLIPSVILCISHVMGLAYQEACNLVGCNTEEFLGDNSLACTAPP